MKMPDVNLVGDVGATLDLTATFEVADTDHLTNFTKARPICLSFCLVTYSAADPHHRGGVHVGYLCHWSFRYANFNENTRDNTYYFATVTVAALGTQNSFAVVFSVPNLSIVE